MDTVALQEAFRRRGGQLPSSVGLQNGGNQPQQTPQTPQQTPQTPQGDMTGQARTQLAQSRPNEAELIIKTLADRLKQLGTNG